MSASFEEYLVGENLISAAELEKADKYRRETRSSLFAALRRTASLSPQALLQAISEYHSTPIVSEDQWQKQTFATQDVSQAFLREHKIIPIEENERGIVLAMEDPSDSQTINAVRLAFERPIIPVVATAEDIQAAIDRLARESHESKDWHEEAVEESANSDVEQLRDMALGAPVVRYVDQMITGAAHARATDIHVEPFDGRVTVRFRIDGMLREIEPPPLQMSKAIASRIKILSGLNIAERRLPQDGRARIRIGDRRLDLRVATMPTIHGEAVAIRLLDNVRRALDFQKLGFCNRDEETIRKHLAAPYGLILVTGPTGSGKTTTLATALSLLNQSHRKILTIEDPIEYEVNGVNQTQAKPEIGLTFANALRSFLRHDPDVLMVGEMRDGETASIGIHAALTGHLVLSTLHTNTAAGAIPRLLDMGIDAFLLASSLRCVVGQRLVRMLCPHCKSLAEDAGQVSEPERGPSDGRRSPHQPIWLPVGCERCAGNGYTDRCVISEVLDVNEEIRALIVPDANLTLIEQAAYRNGMTTMMADGLDKCRRGITSPEEVQRVALDV